MEKEKIKNLCYTLEPGQETPLQKRRRKQLRKWSLQQRAEQEALGLCRCSDKKGNLNRHRFANGCPLHPRKGRRYEPRLGVEIDNG
jgi:hypothetical protein